MVGHGSVKFLSKNISTSVHFDRMFSVLSPTVRASAQEMKKKNCGENLKCYYGWGEGKEQKSKLDLPPEDIYSNHIWTVIIRLEINREQYIPALQSCYPKHIHRLWMIKLVYALLLQLCLQWRLLTVLGPAGVCCDFELGLQANQ